MDTAAVLAAEEPAFFADDPVELDISFGSPPRQSRVTVAFRILLALPHFVVLWVLGLVAGPLLIVGWLAALFLGRLPRWIARYEMGLIAYATRVNAYAYLVADKFPPFGFSARDYSIGVKIGASRLSRARVFFRPLLIIPVLIISGLASQGLLLLTPVTWLITLIRGRTPQALFAAAAAVIRYQARYSAYASLVTDMYPRGLFGDEAWDYVPEWAPEAEKQRLLRVRLALSGGAKGTLGLMVALGIAAAIASLVVSYELSQPPPRSPAVVAAEGRWGNAEEKAIALNRCDLRCEKANERALGEAYFRFASDLSRISFPRSQRKQVAILIVEGRAIGLALIAASKSKDGGLAQGIDPADPPDSPVPNDYYNAVESVLGPVPDVWP